MLHSDNNIAVLPQFPTRQNLSQITLLNLAHLIYKHIVNLPQIDMLKICKKIGT